MSELGWSNMANGQTLLRTGHGLSAYSTCYSLFIRLKYAFSNVLLGKIFSNTTKLMLTNNIKMINTS